MAEQKVIRLTLNNNFIDKVVEQLNMMKTNHNKIVKMASADKDVVLVINHSDNDLLKKKKETKK
ncbi:MAG: hypothetical protein KJ574_02585 [Nanoarchaeota archaeon]|nr:hypothetical protein [Nanoarchaeota archaeon]